MIDDDLCFLRLTATAVLKSELRTAGFVVDTLGALGTTGEQEVTVSGPMLWIDALKTWLPDHFGGMTITECLTELLGDEYPAELAIWAIRNYGDD